MGFVQVLTKAMVAVYRAIGGFGDTVLVTTTGARTGRERVTPVMGFPRDDGSVVVVASANGQDRNPDWFHNLRAHSEVTLELGRDSSRRRARVLTGDERTDVFAAIKAERSNFARYEEKTSREIPVVALDPM